MPRIPPVVAESFRSNESDGGKLQALKDHLDKFNTQFASHFGPYTTQTSVNPTGGSNPSPARTHCRPAFADGDRPLDFTKTLLPAVAKPIADFDSAFELLGKDSLILESSVRMAYILSIKLQLANYRSLRLLGKAPSIVNPGLHVAIVKTDFTVWLLNNSDADVTLPSGGELFGFGTGTFSESPTGKE